MLGSTVLRRLRRRLLYVPLAVWAEGASMLPLRDKGHLRRRDSKKEDGTVPRTQIALMNGGFKEIRSKPFASFGFFATSVS